MIKSCRLRVKIVSVRVRFEFFLNNFRSDSDWIIVSIQTFSSLCGFQTIIPIKLAYKLRCKSRKNSPGNKPPKSKLKNQQYICAPTSKDGLFQG